MKKVEKGTTGTMGHTCPAGIRIETQNQKRKRLISEAYDLDQEYSFIESRLWEIVEEIQDLNPTKQELKSGVQVLIDCYGR
jgi:hypothetical protein